MEKDERDIDVLLKKYEERINQLREKIKDFYDEKEHDEIVLLRYCLSNDNTEKAAKPMKLAKEYREKNESWLKDVDKGEKYAPHYELFTKYTCSAFHKHRADDGETKKIYF